MHRARAAVSLRKRRVLALLLGAALLLAGCGSPKAAPTATARGEPVAGGTAVYATSSTTYFHWMLPLPSETTWTPNNMAVSYGMWRPLYYEGKGASPVINEKLSLAYPPVYSHHDTVVTIRLKHYLWSDGKPVTASDVQFFFDIYKAGKSDVGYYVHGDFPDNVKSLDIISPSELVLHLDGSYSQDWYTDNQLTQIVPLPEQAWDEESASGPVGSYASTPAGAAKVFHFLYSQSETVSTYSTNPLWKVVDGPWVIDTYNPTTFETELSANRSYSGPEKPHLAHYAIEVFQSATAEVAALRSGSIDYGYLPFSDYRLESYFSSHGYTVSPWAPDFTQWAELGYTSPTYGPLVRQLYIRQALQHLVDEPVYLKQALHGFGQLTYGPVPDIPHSPYVTKDDRTDPDPYSVAAARRLLAAHGWTKGPNGYLECTRPGSAGNDCGPGISKGRELSLLLRYEAPSEELAAQAQAFSSAASSAGIDIVLHPESANTQYAVGGVCPPGPCDWGIMLWAVWVWNYGEPAILPTESAQFGKGNYFGGGYYSPEAQRLIDAAHTHTGLSYVYAIEDYLSRQVAALWFPTGDNSISVVKDRLQGWEPQNAFGQPRPSRWYFTS